MPIAGPYDLLIILLVVFGVVLIAPLALSWSRFVTAAFERNATHARLEQQRENDEQSAKRQLRVTLHRRELADAEAHATVAEARRDFAKKAAEKASQDGDFSTLPALTTVVHAQYEPPSH